MTLFLLAYRILMIVKTIQTMKSNATTPTRKNITMKLVLIPSSLDCIFTVTVFVAAPELTKNPSTQYIGFNELLYCKSGVSFIVLRPGSMA